MPVRTIVEDVPTPTANVSARGVPTVRVYRVFEARILDTALAEALLANSGNRSDEDLQELAFANARGGGRGWVNSVLTLPLQPLQAAYTALSPLACAHPISFQGHRLDATVAAILDAVDASKYRRA